MLNDLTIRKLAAPAEGVAQFPDGSIPGFGVRVTSNGVKSFYLAYRHHGKSRRLNLGRYPTTKLQKARAKAFAALSEIEEGRDPSGESSKAEDFGSALDAFVGGYCKRYNRPSTAAETERLLRVYFLPIWQRRSIETITKADVAAALEPVMKRGSQMAARHAFAAVRKMFNWMVEQGAIETSPCVGMKAPAKAGSRDRVLSDGELKAIWNNATTIGYPFGPIVQILMLTAQRRGEVAAMMWADVDTEKGIWTIPGDRTKNGKTHAVPLCPSVLTVLAEVTCTSSPFVFPARGKPEQPYSGYSKGKRELDAAADLHDWTLHDIRRTAATGMARLGIAPHVVERVLNHVSGTFAGVAGIYNRFRYEDEMRGALLAWERQVMAIVDGERG
ncbi:MAG: tyrosine-type recombinase/integrase [Hyphomicrobium sp.]|uniref:tyrosine-type recombinase/integrase n=1 Tax=Hyphomicrobium sp. TaxID=82 RepID=UPI003D0A3C95